MKKIFLIIGLFCVFLCGCEDKEMVITNSNEDENGIQNDVSDEFVQSDETVKMYVYLCGAVNKPGIYEIESDTRAFEVIEMGGGLDEEADADVINQASVVSDGQQIRIPYIGENINIPDDNLIDLNSASVEELCEIPGIGESRANSIIEYREKNNGFKSTEELMNISGIKEATYKKIESYVTVRP